MDMTMAGPRPISQSFADALRMTKKEWVEASPHGSIGQSGGAYVGADLHVPLIPAGDVAAEPQIETFLVDSTGSCSPTGTNAALIAAFLPAATEMSHRILTALREFDVAIEFPAYVTVSVTSFATVTTTPHFDDDQYFAGAGVGVVAIVANGAGPRIACSPLGQMSVREGLPLSLDPVAADQFASGDMPVQQTAANRIVLFPQFGQLHAGPGIVEDAGVSARSLLVFRAATMPH